VRGLDKTAAKLPPTPGDVWRVNLFRMDVPSGKPQQASAWSPPMVGDFHALDKFGDLVFGDDKGNLPAPAATAAAGGPGHPTGGVGGAALKQTAALRGKPPAATATAAADDKKTGGKSAAEKEPHAKQ
jgi:hypothetical protein